MTNDELKKKIVEILCKVWIEPVPCTAERKFEHAADALIAAGIGDVSELKNHRIIAEYSLIPEDGNSCVLPDIPLRITQFYSGEEVEKIVKERDEYKHRAEVSERALRRSISFLTCRACQAFLYGSCDTDACGDERCINNFLKQAEKELSEEKK